MMLHGCELHKHLSWVVSFIQNFLNELCLHCFLVNLVDLQKNIGQDAPICPRHKIFLFSFKILTCGTDAQLQVKSTLHLYIQPLANEELDEFIVPGFERHGLLAGM